MPHLPSLVAREHVTTPARNEGLEHERVPTLSADCQNPWTQNADFGSTGDAPSLLLQATQLARRVESRDDLRLSGGDEEDLVHTARKQRHVGDWRVEMCSRD